jgi:hypothetical protein
MGNILKLDKKNKDPTQTCLHKWPSVFEFLAIIVIVYSQSCLSWNITTCRLNN